VIDLGLGRVALKAANGKVVSVTNPESVVLKDLGGVEPSDAEIFQWINLMRGDTMLMSLMNHRYLATKPNSPGPVTATATGPNPARKGGVCFEWREVTTSVTASFFPLKDVRLLEGPFSDAVKANRQYLLAHDPDRLLAPFRREAGLEPKARPYGNWESGGLDGHTAGHYLSALSLMMASGADPDGKFRRRLDYMIGELAQIQEANGNGYLGGIPGSRDYWASVAEGHVELMRNKWAPWYNLHKMFAGLRDAYVHGGNEKARDLLVRYGDWCDNLTSGLTDAQMQRMLATEYGGMNEVLADIYAITGDKKYIELAKRFNHLAVFEPLENHQDRLTGLHANTQIPKITGLERIAALTDDTDSHSAADFFWQTVTKNRSLAFGGNSVSEHFNPPDDFRGMVENREGPETCNTYNMLRLTRQLFAAEPKADYADFYERALYNHILSAINVEHPGYVYFTPIRPDHYRVYSQPETSFWCCVGTGMENPGRYGEFIYAKAKDGIYVNLFIPSELKADDGVVLRQETRFPYEASTKLALTLEKPATFTLYLRHPSWVSADEFAIIINGEPFGVQSQPSSYAEIRREWQSGDTVEVTLPMHTSVERLPDGSDWVAILHGPIVLAKPDGTEDMTGLFADSGRMAHVAQGPMVRLDKVPALLTTPEDLPAHVAPDPTAGPLDFRIKDVIEPAEPEGLPLVPFFSLHERRYQMYWELTTPEEMATQKEKLAAEERARAAREATTIDRVVVGEQQSEVEHDFKGERTETGIHNGRRWRHGAMIQYTLDTRGEKAVDLEVTYWGGDSGRAFDILVGGTRIATQVLNREEPNEFVAKRYPIPQQVLKAAPDRRVTIEFVATRWLAGGLFDVRLMRHEDDAP
ncbi:MAG TPA: glycoside hydrolase family 127 protein, partial [Thermoguttaceae bacterium]|nr:glycoside hydrolase family 127 protein [Thermoguttaceae bacterium]